MSKPGPCECGAPVTYHASYGAYQSSTSWKCGASHEYDGPGNPCPNQIKPEPKPEPVEASPAKAEEVDNLPAVLTSAQVTERELRRLEAYKGEVLADVTDAKAAKALTAKRLECRAVRLTATRICKGEREEAVRIQKEWVAIEKGIEARLDPVEAHLASEANRHDDWKAEQARIAEAARIARIKARIEDLVRIGAEIDMTEVEALDDAEWSQYIELTRASIDAQNVMRERAQALTNAGDICTVDEVLELTADQYAHRLEVALKAKSEREETARIAAEEEAKAKEAEYAKVLEIQSENARLKAEREETERELRKMREEKAEAERKRVEAEQAARREVERKELAEKEAAEQAKREAERVEAERIRKEREEALRPEREKIAIWAEHAIQSFPMIPEIADYELNAKVRDTFANLKHELLLLQKAMA